jgi:hypothetical protein
MATTQINCRSEPATTIPKIYVASRVRHARMWRDKAHAGMPIISTWIYEDGEGETESLSELWERILSEIKNADRLILYIGRDDFPLKGALVEAGMALALNVPVYLVMESGVRESLQYPSLRPLGSWAMSPGVKWCDSFDEAT